MSTLELTERELVKGAIRQRLESIDDPQILDVVLTLTDRYHRPRPLTREQREDIEISKSQFENGEWIDHDDFMRELDEEFGTDEG